MRDANVEYVQKLRVNERATDQEIQDALRQLFKSSPQAIQNHQGQLILIETSPQGNFESETRTLRDCSNAISKIQLNNALKNSLYSSLQNESPYSEISLEDKDK